MAFAYKDTIGHRRTPGDPLNRAFAGRYFSMVRSSCITIYCCLL